MLLYACSDRPSKNHGPIVLGDSSTIVTEKDPKKLMDLVTDLQPDIPPAANPDSAAKPAEAATADAGKKDTAKAGNKAAAVAEALPDVAGLKAEFKEVNILIPGVTARISGNSNLKTATGAVYTLLSGTLDGTTIRVMGNVTRVMQKTQSVLIIKNKLGSLPLDNLGSTSEFETVKAAKGAFPVTNIDEESLPYPKINNNAIRNAVTRAANKRRLSHKKLQEWLNSVSAVHSANQKPMVVTLRSVIWKIEGKDDNGKAFSKQIRIDIPI